MHGKQQMHSDAGIALYAGVDGGGTRCRVRLRWPDGSLAGEGVGGRANLYASIDDSHASIIEAMRAAMPSGQTIPLESVACGLGLAGAGVPAAARALEARLPFARSIIVTDGAAALNGAFSGKDGAIAILGTGAAYQARKGGIMRTVGGWGFHVADQGSGADLGRLAMRRALLAYDGIAAPSRLTTELLKQFDGDPLKLITFARDATPAEYGGFSPLVFDCLEAGDINARGIIDEALQTITASLRLVTAGVDRLCLLGGLAPRYRLLLEAEFGGILQDPEADAMEGALLLARGAPS